MENIKRMDYEWMIKATPQSEWIEKKGIFLMLAFFLSEIGAGIYFLSMIFGNKNGLILGWILTLALGGGIHIYYLGNPLRFWRIFLKPKTSELSRGVWVILIFAVIGFFQIAGCTICNYLYMKVIMGILCLLLIMHGFATMNTMKALPAWNSSAALPLSVISGLWVGYQLVEIVLRNTDNSRYGAEPGIWALIMLITYIICLIMYLWGTAHSSDVAGISVQEILKGSGSKLFYIFVAGIGILIPLIITLGMRNSASPSIVSLSIRLLAVFTGDLALRYILMKNAYYTPLI